MGGCREGEIKKNTQCKDLVGGEREEVEKKFEREGEREREERRREGWKVREKKRGGERIRPFIHASGDGRSLNSG